MKKFSMQLHADNKCIGWKHSDTVPRVGDTVRRSPKHYYTVTEVVWCFDEEGTTGARINIGLKKIK